jgi:hypothetical protein
VVECGTDEDVEPLVTQQRMSGTQVTQSGMLGPRQEWAWSWMLVLHRAWAGTPGPRGVQQRSPRYLQHKESEVG